MRLPEAAVKLRCRICDFAIGRNLDDDMDAEICADCKGRPEARRLLMAPADRSAIGSGRSARAFTDAERSLIAKVHGFMPRAQLLDLLNERLRCDLGPDAPPYTSEQLHTEIGTHAAEAAVAGSAGWAQLRRLLATARRNGVLAQITEQVIKDFAVVFSLNPKQVSHLFDVIASSKEDA